MNLNIYYQNVRSLGNKYDEFLTASSLCEYDIIGLTETWLRNEISNSEFIDTSEYHVFRQDRDFVSLNVSRGGGVLLAFNKCFVIEKLDLTIILNSIKNLEILGCKCCYHSRTFYVFIVYFSKTPSIDDLKIFTSYFEENHIHSNQIILLGDFNIPYFVSNPFNSLVSHLNIFADLFSFKQFNNTLNFNGNLLDLVFTNFECSITRDLVPMVAEDGHHPALSISIISTVHSPASNFTSNLEDKTYNFSKANFVNLYRDLLEVDWSELTYIKDVNTMCSKFYKILYSVFDKNVPYYRKTKYHYPQWYTKTIIFNIRQKTRILKRYKNFGNESDLMEFKRLRTLIKLQISEAYSCYLADVENSISDDPKKFWTYINAKKRKSRIPGKVYKDGISYDNPQAIVDAFATFFESTFINSGDSNQLPQCESSLPFFNISKITEEQVVKAIKSLKNSFTTGPDGIPSFIVKDCCNVLCEPLLIIFNTGITSSTFPMCWRTSKVCPILKSGDSSVINNYRPISILSNFAKVFEKILYTSLYSHVESFISPQQHGFVNRRSTITNLSCFSQQVAEVLNKQGQVDVIYTDFTKAFDQIDHSIILHKLQLFGLSNKLCSFLSSYLTNRSQYVSYNGFKSSEYLVTSGVPQGSNLGPLIFLLFINDLPTYIEHCPSLLFADDTKVHNEIKSESDCLGLQLAVDNLTNWCFINRLALNVQKCKVITFSRKKHPLIYDYNINNTRLERFEIVKDLGVYFDSNFNFNHHANEVAKSAAVSLGFILRNTKGFNNIRALKNLYNAFVVSKLEYASLIWSPIYSCYKTMLERIQRKFLKHIWFKLFGHYPPQGFDHNQLLVILNFKSLEQRRISHFLIFLYKLINYKIDCSYLLSKLSFIVPRSGSRKPLCLQTPLCRSDVLKSSPVYKMSCNCLVL